MGKCLRDLLESKETGETLRRRLRDTAWCCLTHFRDHVTERMLASRNLHSWSRKSPWHRIGESASNFLVSRVARVAAADQSRRRLRQWERPLRPYLIGLETRWRPGGDSSLCWLRRCLCNVSWRLAGSPGSHGKFKHVRFFGGTFSSLQQVSEMYPRPAGEQGDWGDWGDVWRRYGDVSVTCWRLEKV